MAINSHLKNSLVVVVFVVFGGVSALSAVADNSSAPTATPEEAKIKHWGMPEIGLSFTDIPELEKAYVDATPFDMKDGVPVGKLNTSESNKDILFTLAKEIFKGKHGNYDSLLIAHNGKLVFESYYKRGRVDLSHPQSSATKTYTGLALGRAIQLGYLSMADLDKPVHSFLSELDPAKFVEGAESITLRQALTMTTGIVLSQEQWKNIRENPSEFKGQKEVQAMFEQSEPITPDTQTFRYGTGPGIVMQIIESVVPDTAENFIKNELFGKMGITNYDWRTAPNGLPAAGWKASLTSRDMLKLGILAQDKGRWKGKQIIPEAYIAEATSRQVYTGDDDIYGGGKDVSNQGYGYFWWGTDLTYDDKQYVSTSAQGGGGVYIMLVDALDLIIVVTAHEREDKTQQLVAERILPAFI